MKSTPTQNSPSKQQTSTEQSPGNSSRKAASTKATKSFKQKLLPAQRDPKKRASHFKVPPPKPMCKRAEKLLKLSDQPLPSWQRSKSPTKSTGSEPKLRPLANSAKSSRSEPSSCGSRKSRAPKSATAGKDQPAATSMSSGDNLLTSKRSSKPQHPEQNSPNSSDDVSWPSKSVKSLSVIQSPKTHVKQD